MLNVVDRANVACGSMPPVSGAVAVPRLTYHTLRPEHLREIALQPSQGMALGMPNDPSDEEIEAICAMPLAWCVKQAGRVLACFGIVETFPDRQGWGWANLSTGIGGDHFALTRFVREEVANRALPRTEVLCRAPDLEREIAASDYPLDSGQLVALAMAKATPEMRWAVLLGFRPAHLLRAYGAAMESYMLFELLNLTNVRPTASMPEVEGVCGGTS